MDKQTTIADIRQPVATEKYSIGFTDSVGFELGLRISRILAKSTLVPKDYINNEGNCMIALNMANRLGADPLMIMQNLVIIHGKPSWSAKFLIATVNSCGRFSALRYAYFGTEGQDDWGCYAYAVEKSTGEKLDGIKITISLAKAEGWYSKNGSKWKTMPQKMLMYRAGAWWCDLYAPELSMGLKTDDEMRDIIEVDKFGNVVDEDNRMVEDVRRPRKKVDAEPVNEAKAVENEKESQQSEPIMSNNVQDSEMSTELMNMVCDLMGWIDRTTSEKDRGALQSMITDNFNKAPHHIITGWWNALATEGEKSALDNN